MSDEISAVTHALIRTYREIAEYIRRDESELKYAQENVKRSTESLASNRTRLTELQQHGLANGLDLEAAYNEERGGYA
jgi:hypothetical protein